MHCLRVKQNYKCPQGISVSRVCKKIHSYSPFLFFTIRVEISFRKKCFNSFQKTLAPAVTERFILWSRYSKEMEGIYVFYWEVS